MGSMPINNFTAEEKVKPHFIIFALQHRFAQQFKNSGSSTIFHDNFKVWRNSWVRIRPRKQSHQQTRNRPPAAQSRSHSPLNLLLVVKAEHLCWFGCRSQLLLP